MEVGVVQCLGRVTKWHQEKRETQVLTIEQVFAILEPERRVGDRFEALYAVVATGFFSVATCRRYRPLCSNRSVSHSLANDRRHLHESL